MAAPSSAKSKNPNHESVYNAFKTLPVVAFFSVLSVFLPVVCFAIRIILFDISYLYSTPDRGNILYF